MSVALERRIQHIEMRLGALDGQVPPPEPFPCQAEKMRLELDAAVETGEGLMVALRMAQEYQRTVEAGRDAAIRRVEAGLSAIASERGRLAGLPPPRAWQDREPFEKAIRDGLRTLDAIESALR